MQTLSPQRSLWACYGDSFPLEYSTNPPFFLSLRLGFEDNVLIEDVRRDFWWDFLEKSTLIIGNGWEFGYHLFRRLSFRDIFASVAIRKPI